MAFDYVPVTDKALERLEDELFQASRDGLLYVQCENIIPVTHPKNVVGGFPCIMTHIPHEQFGDSGETVQGKLILVVVMSNTDRGAGAKDLRKMVASIRLFISGTLKNRIGEMYLSGKLRTEFQSWDVEGEGSGSPTPLHAAKMSWTTRYKERTAV